MRRHSQLLYTRTRGWAKETRNIYRIFKKNFVDYLHAYHSRQSNFKVSNFTKNVDSIHYYDSIMIIEKEKEKHQKT